MNIITFFHRFLGPARRSSPAVRPATSLPIEQRYWSPYIDGWLRAHRWQRRFDPPHVLQWEDVPLRLIAGGAFGGGEVSDSQWLWTAWATLELGAPLSVVHRFLAENHYWAPNYPGHILPVLRDAAGERADMNMRELIALAAPAEATDGRRLTDFFDRAVLDQRLAVFACLDCGEEPLPDGETLRSLLDIDVPSGMEAPESWTNTWLAERTYRRWQDVLYGFTHHSGLVLRRKNAWMESLCLPPEDLDGPRNRGCYFDLALLAFTEAALSVLAADAAAHLWRVFPTPLDQGRELLATWRRAYRRDLCLSSPNRS